MSEIIKEVSIEAMQIGVTPSGRRVWMGTKVIIEYENRKEIEEFETAKEAHEYVGKLFRPKLVQGELKL